MACSVNEGNSSAECIDVRIPLIAAGHKMWDVTQFVASRSLNNTTTKQEMVSHSLTSIAIGKERFPITWWTEWDFEVYQVLMVFVVPAIFVLVGVFAIIGNAAVICDN